MTEYRWYFGYGKPDEWLRHRPGTYTQTFWNAFSDANSGMNTAYIYDEYDNLLYVINHLKPTYKRISYQLRKDFKSKDDRFLTNEESQRLFNHLEYIQKMKRSKFEEALELVERAIVEKAKKLMRAA